MATGEPVDPATLTPPAWRELAVARGPGREVPLRMTDDADPSYQPWQPTGEPNAVDRAIAATRKAVVPLLGLDPHDPRD